LGSLWSEEKLSAGVKKKLINSFQHGIKIKCRKRRCVGQGDMEEPMKEETNLLKNSDSAAKQLTS
jgi:hypothetical protein